MTAFPKPGPKKKTAREIYAEVMKPKRSKYGNKRSLCALNHSHRSRLESAVCGIIQRRESDGHLKLLQVEDHVKLSDWYNCIPDFKCLDIKTGEIFWIEAKGDDRAGRWPDTRKGWKHVGPGKMEVWKGNWRRPFLDEVITPKGKP